PLVSTAQTISGTIRDAQTDEPLIGANILQINTDNGAASQKEGHFKLELVSGNHPKIRISYIGYKTKIIDTNKRDWPSVIYLEPETLMTNAIFVEALRVKKTTPMAYQTLTSADIEEDNFGQDLPYLLNTTPSVVVSSDAGAGIGYTGVRIRGVDPTRINVTINGVPVNDAESQAVFWVNMPNIASSVQSIQIQRGVGTSTNGAAAFGASVNVQTTEMKDEPFGDVTIGGGSFNTRKFNTKFGTGLLNDRWQVQGRLSKIYSDGYIDRAFSDLKSFYLGAARHGDNSLLRVDIFSGKEKTYQAWTGVPEQKLHTDRTFNPLGQEKPGKPYQNQTDNYQQDYYQLHYSYNLTDNWNANIALHYTRGRGYYEEYEADQKLSNYKIEPIVRADTTIKRTDLIRQEWLDNYFYGFIFSTAYKKENWSLTVGGGYNQYLGDHFGELVWVRHAGKSESGDRYYFNDAFKTDGNIYTKLNYTFGNGISAYVDMQVRHIMYEFLGKDLQTKRTGNEQEVVDLEQTDRLTFFNPKVGLVYQTGAHRFFASLAVAHREPTRDLYVNSIPENRPQAEALYDWEVGYQGTFKDFYVGMNLYYMNYNRQLVPTGQINDTGAEILQNVPDSYRAGIELQGGLRLISWLNWSGNVTFSRNKIDEYTQYITKVDEETQISRTFSNTNIAMSPSVIGSSIFNFHYKGFSADFITKYISRQYLDNTQKTSRSIDPYLVNNLQISYDFSGIKFVQNIEASLKVNNIFNEMYSANGYTYGYIENGQEKHFNYYFPQAGTNILAQLKINF
ncbi:MAG TPA: TonB-dependent receptor, partial [Balneolaceae bacterium]|nr:TonB-dependent receptor [Balneolaceae bacterium]